MAKSIAEKLLLKAGASLWVSDPGRRDLLGLLPPGVTDAPRPTAASVAVLVVESGADARRLLKTHGKALPGVPLVWVLYPKGGRADINRDTLWPIVAEHGMRPNGQVAIDETWSALRFRAPKPGEPPFDPGRRPTAGG